MYPIEKYKFTTYDQENSDGTVSKVVVAISTYGGKTVRGKAKCHSTDEFDLETGKRLAAARCDFKVCYKRWKYTKKVLGELGVALEELNTQYRQMLDRYTDALEEVHNSSARLVEIEKPLD